MARKNKHVKDIGDDMLDNDGMIVEPDVRASIKKYFKKMGMRETTYTKRSTFFANKWQDPQDEYYDDNDDPVGLKLHKRQMQLDDEVHCRETIRETVREMLNESPGPESLRLGIITVPGTGIKTNLTVIYSIPAMGRSLSRLFGTRVQEPIPVPDDLVIAGVEWGKPSEAIDGDGDGPCNYAYVVRRTVTSFPGWGRMAYIAAVSSAGELGPDRGVVKDRAEKAWKAIAGNLEAHPYDDLENPQTPEPDDDCRIHHGRPILNASYSINGSTPTDITKMLQDGLSHFGMLEKHGGNEIVSMAKKILKIEFDTIFTEKYRRQ